MIVNTTLEQQKNGLDNVLRPTNWDSYIGQEKVKKTLKVMIEATKKRKDPLDHVLFYGNPGLGKTTLSYIIARDLNVNIHVTSGPALRRSGDLASILSNLNEGDVLFIDEIHRLNKICEEMIYPALEDFKLDLIVGKGPMAQNMEINLPRFTLIGATTKISLISSPLRSRFGAKFQLNPYTHQELEKIIEQSAKVLNIKITPQATQMVAQCSRFTPRVSNHLLKRVRDFTQVKGDLIIDVNNVEEAFHFLEIDKMGLGPEDRKLLRIIIESFKGGPVGLQTLAAATSEEEHCITELYEPYLMQIGFLERTIHGRKATPAAYNYLGLTAKNSSHLV